jgi:hypothetical protein
VRSHRVTLFVWAILYGPTRALGSGGQALRDTELLVFMTATELELMADGTAQLPKPLGRQGRALYTGGL